MTRIPVAVSTIVILATLFAPASARMIAPGVAANQVTPTGCTAATIAGGWGYSGAGVAFVGPDGAPQPGGTRADLAVAGLITYDGAGRLTGADTQSLGGTILRRTYAGSYAVSPDCTGTLTLTDNLGQNARVAFTLHEGRTRASFLQTDPAVVLAGSATQLRGGCTNASTVGAYGSRMAGVLYADADGAPRIGGARTEVAAVATVPHDGAGGLSVTATASFGGVIAPFTGTGTYDTRPDCTGTLSIATSLGLILTADYVVADGGREAHVVFTNPCTALVAVSRR
jgi:hypothetical protein